MFRFSKLFTKQFLKPTFTKQFTPHFRKPPSRTFTNDLVPKINPIKFYIYVGGAIVAFILAAKSCTVVPAGCVGVVDFLGNVSKETLKPGFHLVNPLSTIVKFSTKTQQLKMTSSVPSKEGLLVKLETSVLYHVNPESVVDIYTTIGRNYSEILLEPNFRSAIRTITSNYEAKALYSRESREKMSQELKDELKHHVEHRGFIIEEAPLRNVELPEKLTAAIELKLSSEQESQRMKFVLEKEKLEAERKRIEAEGIAQFQKIVTEGISEQLLVWKGIEATERLAESPNAKVIVIGGKNGLPLILDGK